MPFEEYKAEIALLLDQLGGKAPEDEHEILMQLHILINTLRAEGLPVPTDLKALEVDLDARFTAEADDGSAD